MNNDPNMTRYRVESTAIELARLLKDTYKTIQHCQTYPTRDDLLDGVAIRLEYAMMLAERLKRDTAIR